MHAYKSPMACNYSTQKCHTPARIKKIEHYELLKQGSEFTDAYLINTYLRDRQQGNHTWWNKNMPTFVIANLINIVQLNMHS